MNLEDADEGSKIIYTVLLCSIGSHTPIIEGIPSHVLFIWEKQKPWCDPFCWLCNASGCVHTDSWEPEAASALKWPRAPGLPRFSIWWEVHWSLGDDSLPGKEIPTQQSPTPPPHHMDQQASQCPPVIAASQLAIRGLVLLCSWVAFICVNKAPASVWPVNKETGLPSAWRPSPKLVHLAQGHPNLCVWWGQVREERISKALLSTCPQKINVPKLQQKSESLGECWLKIGCWTKTLEPLI